MSKKQAKLKLKRKKRIFCKLMRKSFDEAANDRDKSLKIKEEAEVVKEEIKELQAFLA